MSSATAITLISRPPKGSNANSVVDPAAPTTPAAHAEQAGARNATKRPPIDPALFLSISESSESLKIATVRFKPTKIAIVDAKSSPSVFTVFPKSDMSPGIRFKASIMSPEVAYCLSMLELRARAYPE